MYYVLVGLIVLVCTVLVLVIIVQNSKGGGINSSFGVSNIANQIVGARQSGEVIHKITWYLVGVLAALIIIANFTIGGNQKETKTGLRMGGYVGAPKADPQNGPGTPSSQPQPTQNPNE